MTEYNCKSLNIRNLDKRVTEQELKGIFGLISPIKSVKLINDNKNVSNYYLSPPLLFNNKTRYVFFFLHEKSRGFTIGDIFIV